MAQSKWSTPGPSGRDSNTEFSSGPAESGAPGGLDDTVVNDADPIALVRAVNDAFGTNAAGPANPGWMVGKSPAPAANSDGVEGPKGHRGGEAG